MIAGLYAKKKRAQVMGIWNAFIPIGSALGIGLGGIVATRWGWQHAFGLFAALTTLISALILFVALTFCHGALRYTGILLVGLTIIAFLPAAAAITPRMSCILVCGRSRMPSAC
jgi:MFS family permease